MISRTFGAPAGGATRGAHHGLESLALSLMTPPNSGGGGGSWFPGIVVVALGDPNTPVICGAAPAPAGDVACAWAAADPKGTRRRRKRSQAPPSRMRETIAVGSLFPPPKPLLTIGYLPISALIFCIALAQPTLTSI